MKIVEESLDQIINWKDNPRSINNEDMQRLIYQIETLGVYKPIVVTRALKSDNTHKRYIALGGNQRLKAFKKIGIKKVLCSIVNANTQKQRMEYSLSDNDRAGYYDRSLLSNLVSPLKDDIDLDMFKLDLGQLTGLNDILENPLSIELEGGEDIIEGEIVQCPKCGFEFIP